MPGDHSVLCRMDHGQGLIFIFTTSMIKEGGKEPQLSLGDLSGQAGGDHALAYSWCQKSAPALPSSVIRGASLGEPAVQSCSAGGTGWMDCSVWWVWTGWGQGIEISSTAYTVVRTRQQCFLLLLLGCFWSCVENTLSFMLLKEGAGGRNSTNWVVFY